MYFCVECRIFSGGTLKVQQQGVGKDGKRASKIYKGPSFSHNLMKYNPGSERFFPHFFIKQAGSTCCCFSNTYHL